MLEIQRFDPAACQFPRPRAAILPTLAWSDLTFGSMQAMAPAVTRGAAVQHFARGRYALAAAYRAAGVGPAGTLLAPAYHCRTMLDPALALGGSVHFYSLNSDLTPDIDSIRTALAVRPHGVKALLVAHYFGFEQPEPSMSALVALCRQHGIVLIEDCSHAWMVAMRRAANSEAGSDHMVVASPYKFFACADGGTLWGHAAEAGARPARQSLASELRACVTAFQQCVTSTPEAPVDAPPSSVTANASRGEDRREVSDQPSRLYCSALEGTASLAASRWIMRRTRIHPAIQRRRANYQAWVRAVKGLPGARVLFPELPQDCAPYMFPLYIAAPAQQFFALKQTGMPIWRWDEMAVSDCEVATAYRLHLLHLPCHQGLSARQMQWMTGTVAQVLA